MARPDAGHGQGEVIDAVGAAELTHRLGAPLNDRIAQGEQVMTFDIFLGSEPLFLAKPRPGLFAGFDLVL